jgi:molybdenum-dependent DNA-binding transcriptional regulator ModE
MVEVVNGGDNSTYSKNTNLGRRAIHIHRRMEHNLSRYVKYYSYGCIEISGSSEFTKETDHSKRHFSKH